MEEASRGEGMQARGMRGAAAPTRHTDTKRQHTRRNQGLITFLALPRPPAGSTERGRPCELLTGWWRDDWLGSVLLLLVGLCWTGMDLFCADLLLLWALLGRLVSVSAAS